MDTQISITYKLSKVLTDESEISRVVDMAIGAGMFKVEKAYVDEAPGNFGKFKQGIQRKKNRALDYVVESTAKRSGFDYPLALFTGTRKMKGKPDFGFTTGRVRANDIAYGIGGIRPNKAATRAKRKVEKDFINFVNSRIKQSI